MKLNKTIKILVGAGTAWIILYPLLFIAAWFSMMAGFLSSNPAETPLSMFPAFSLLFPAHCFTMVLQFVLMGFYLVHIIKNTQASDAVRTIFGVGIFFLSFFAMPAYYYFFIWRSTPPDWALPKETHPVDPSAPVVSANPPEQSRSSGKKLAIVGGIIGAILLALFGSALVLSRLAADFNQRMHDQYFAIPTPVHYENIPVYQPGERALYQPVEITAFAPLNTFKEIYAWSDYNQTPILVSNNDLFIAGYLQEPGNSWGSGLNVDVISANIETAEVNWQAVAGSGFLLKDSRHIYAAAPDNFGAAGIVAYDIDTGSLAWETRFEYDQAVGIGQLTLTETGISAETYNHGNEALYTVDLETGDITDVVKGVVPYAQDEVVVHGGMQFSKRGYGIPDKVTATTVDNGSLVWEYAGDPVVSNIAVGGAVTYFLTQTNKLMAIDTNTGEVLGELALAPRFPRDFDFVNTSLIVAAEEDVVAVYYEDSKQLSVFRFTGPAK